MIGGLPLRSSNAGRLKFLGIWRAGPVVPVTFTAETDFDFRNDAECGRSLDLFFFPRRKLAIIGVRSDQTMFMIYLLSLPKRTRLSKC